MPPSNSWSQNPSQLLCYTRLLDSVNRWKVATQKEFPPLRRLTEEKTLDWLVQTLCIQNGKMTLNHTFFISEVSILHVDFFAFCFCFISPP